MEKFSNRLKELRKEKNISLSQLAKDLNISKSCLSMYENNKTSPTLDVLIKLADYFCITLDYLAGRTDS